MEEVFKLIEEGNKLENTNKDYWSASSKFCNAMTILFELAVAMEPTSEKEEQISTLYQNQCKEYLHRARKALVAALKAEDETDRSGDEDTDPIFITITDEVAAERSALFGTLFSKQLDSQGVAEEEEEITLEQVQNKQVSLEDRLKSLNDSLPSVLKSDKERMKDIDKGLKGLGLNLTSHLDVPKPSIAELPVASPEDQMAEIISQAQDEVRTDALIGKKDGIMDDDNVTLTDDEAEEGDIVLSDEESEIDLDNDIPKLRNKKAIRSYIANAQAKLAQLSALFDNEDKKANDVTEETQDVPQDEASDDGDEDILVGVDLDFARMLLLKASKNISKAKESWEVEL